MKKLMLVAAIAFAAVCSQAATVTWTLTNVYGPDGSALVGNTYSAYLMTTATASLGSWGDLESPADVLTAAAKGYKMTWGADGKFSNATATDITAINASSTLALAGGASYDFYAVVVDAAGENYYLTTTKPVTISSGTDNSAISFGSQKNATMGKTDAWTEVVPEPTSGLLLLIGMAGLALRRKQA